jgi:DNA polymerase III alpha subunit
MRMGLTILPPDVNASDFRTTGRGREVRIGLQFVKGLSAKAAERIVDCRLQIAVCSADSAIGNQQSAISNPYTSLDDLRTRASLTPDDLHTLVKMGALDSIKGDHTRPMLLWEIDQNGGVKEWQNGGMREALPLEDATIPPFRHSTTPPLREYTTDRRRRAEYELLGFTTDSHPMHLHAADLARFRITKSAELADHVGESVLCCGMLTTSKPISTITEEPMEFATFDDGYGLIETVLFPRVFRERGHVLFDQGPFVSGARWMRSLEPLRWQSRASIDWKGW